MGRLIGSVVLGYVVIVVVIFVGFTILWSILGPSGTFQPGTWAPSGAWAFTTIVLGLVAAAVGGAICARVSKEARGPKVLAVVVLILGFAFAIPALTGSAERAPGPRPDQVTMTEAMQHAEQPIWVTLINPLIGALGVLIGGGLVAGRRKPETA